LLLTNPNQNRMNQCANCPFHQKDREQCLFDLHHKDLSHFSFKKNEIVFSEKQSLKGIYCIKEGTCLISKTCSNGRDQIIELLSRGTLLGTRSVLCEEQTNLKAKVIIPMKGCFLPKIQFLKLLKEKPEFSLFLTKELARYIKKTDNKIISMGQKKMHQRVAEVISSMSIHFNTHPDGYIDIKLRREDLANLVGIATESLIRVISYFQENNGFQLKADK